jgi:formamidopyrimidine-DNA glycosylase
MNGAQRFQATPNPRALGKITVGDEKVGDPRANFHTGPSRAWRGIQDASKLFLLDQSHIAEIGNIYAAKALFRARRIAGSLRRAQRYALFTATVEVLPQAAAESERIYNPPGNEFPADLYGWKGHPCHVCHSSIRRIPQGGYSTYFRTVCQR